MTKSTDNAVLNKCHTINNGKTKTNAIEWYIPHYIPSIIQQNILLKQIFKKMARELQYPERSVFMKEVNTQKFWTFELGTQEEINKPVWVFVIFRQSDREHDQNLNNETFNRMPVTSCQCIIGTQKYPDSGVLRNYNGDDYSQGYGQIKKAFRALTKDDILQPDISKMVLDRLMMVMMLTIISTFSIYDIGKFLKVLNQSE